jgi:hypothetical protein
MGGSHASDGGETMRPQQLQEDQLTQIPAQTPAALEEADTLIPLARASEISGVADSTLLDHAGVGRLQAVLQADQWWTTRRWLHVYLLNDLGEHRGRPLPPGYVAPDGEPRRKLRHYLVQ